MENHQPPVESLTYKELQGLAMALNLPGKMKQGVLVEAIKARQNNNEQQVEMILEANRQRRLERRQYQQQQQQQQLSRINGNPKRKCAILARYKRSASEMEEDDDEPSPMDEETMKRSKLAAALQRPIYAVTQASSANSSMSFSACRDTQQQQQHQHMSWPHLIHNSSSSSPSLPHHHYHHHHQQQGLQSVSMLSTLLTSGQLPDLSKDLAVLPTMSDCSDRASTVGSCSTTGSNWVSLPSSSDQNSIHPGFESYDSGWNDSSRSANTYDLAIQGSWRNNNPKTELPSNSSNSIYDINTPPPSDNSQSHSLLSSGSAGNSSGFLEDDIFNTGVEPCRPEEFITPVSVLSSVSPPLNSSNSSTGGGDSTYHELSTAPTLATTSLSTRDWGTYPIATQPPQFASLQSHYHQHMANAPLHDALRFRSEFYYNLSLGYPHFFPHQPQVMMTPTFRLQPPGNPRPLVIHSGRNLTMTTFSNMLPRVASYVQYANS